MTLRFAADENFNNNIIRGLHRQNPHIDIVRVQDTAVYQADDPTVLEWATGENRILLTHDVRTMPKYVYEHIQSGSSMPGVFIIDDNLAIGRVIEDLLTIDGASEATEWKNKVLYLPL